MTAIRLLAAAGAVSGPAQAVGTPAEVFRAAPGTLYLAQEHLSSTALVLDADGAPVGRPAYRPYGESAHRSEDQAGYGPRFAGKERQSTVDPCLYYFEARYYDACLARFLSIDRARQFSGPYAYTAAEPLAQTDPTGDIAIDWAKVVGRGGKTLIRGVLGSVTTELMVDSYIRNHCDEGRSARGGGDAPFACRHPGQARVIAGVTGFMLGAGTKFLADHGFAEINRRLPPSAGPAPRLFIAAHLPYGVGTLVGTMATVGLVASMTARDFDKMLPKALEHGAVLYAGMLTSYYGMAKLKKRLKLGTLDRLVHKGWNRDAAGRLMQEARTPGPVQRARLGQLRRELGAAYYLKPAVRLLWETGITVWLGTGFGLGAPALCAATSDPLPNCSN